MQSDQTVKDEDMADFTSADVKRLRDATGAGILDCKNALAEAGGGFEQGGEMPGPQGGKDVARRAPRGGGHGAHAGGAAGPGPRGRRGRRPTGSSRRRSTARAPGSWSS